MHVDSSEQYCNTTFIKEDFQRKMDKVNDKMIINIRNLVSTGKQHGQSLYEQATPHLNRAQQKVAVLALKVGPHVIAGKEKAEELYQTHVTPHLAEMVIFYSTHGKPFMESTVLPTYDTYGAPTWIRCQEAVRSIQLSLISALELTSISGRDYTQGLKKAAKKDSKESKIKIPHETIIYSFTAVNKNAEKIIDAMWKMCLVFIILIIFKRPLKPLIYVAVTLPLRLSWFISKPFVVLPLRLLWFLSPLRLILGRRM